MERIQSLANDSECGSRSAASSVSSEPLSISARSTPFPEEPARKRARIERRHGRDTVEERGGDVFSKSVAQDGARQHNGHVYGGIHHHYPEAPLQAPPVTGNTGQNDIASALEALNFARVDARRNNISREHRNTCKWLFDKLEYKNWRDPGMMPIHHGFFWIKSKPGAGKSTLMNFLVKSAKRRLREDTTISFFFHARGEALERSLEGMYRSLLHQLLTAFPRLQHILTREEAASSSSHGWPLETLKSMFHDAVLALGKDKLTCFIDALDECPEDDIRALIKALSELSESAIDENLDFHVCFSSRFYPNISIKKCQHLELDGQPGHQQDITDYVQSELLGDDEAILDIKSQVEERARGIFLWAVLVVQILNKDSDQGNAHKMQHRLDEIPNGLHRLFEDILQRGKRDNEHLLHILQWVFYARRPLSRAELYFAIHSGASDRVFTKPWDANRITLKNIDLFILNSSKGLVECSVNANDEKKSTVQFIHESVRDYLRSTGFKALAPPADENLEGLTHDYIRMCCATSIAEAVLEHGHTFLPDPLPKAKSEDAQALRQRVRDSFPFLEYAVGNVIHHTEIAYSSGIPQGDFVINFHWARWRVFNNVFAIHDSRRHTGPSNSVTYALAEHGALGLLKLREALAEQSLLTSPQLTPALRVSLANNHPQAFKVLYERHFELYRPERHEHRDLLELAMKRESMDAASVLLKSVKRFLNPSQSAGRLFNAACATGNVDFVHLLARHVDLAAVGASELMKALDIGLRRGHADIVRFLLKHGADVNNEVYDILTRAIKAGKEDIVRILLDDGAHISLVQKGTDAPVQAYPKGYAFAHNQTSRGANLDVVTIKSNLLWAACEAGHIGIVRLLLEHGAELNINKWMWSWVGKAGGLAMVSLLGQAAISDPSGSIIELFFKYGASSHTAGGKPYYDALERAIANGHERATRILVANGHGVAMEQPAWYNRILCRAIFHLGDGYAAKLLDEIKAFQAQSNSTYADALEYAKERRCTEVVSKLRERGVRLTEETAAEEEVILGTSGAASPSERFYRR